MLSYLLMLSTFYSLFLVVQPISFPSFTDPPCSLPCIFLLLPYVLPPLPSSCYIFPFCAPPGIVTRSTNVKPLCTSCSSPAFCLLSQSVLRCRLFLCPQAVLLPTPLCPHLPVGFALRILEIVIPTCASIFGAMRLCSSNFEEAMMDTYNIRGKRRQQQRGQL